MTITANIKEKAQLMSPFATFSTDAAHMLICTRAWILRRISNSCTTHPSRSFRRVFAAASSNNSLPLPWAIAALLTLPFEGEPLTATSADAERRAERVPVPACLSATTRAATREVARALESTFSLLEMDEGRLRATFLRRTPASPSASLTFIFCGIPPRDVLSLAPPVSLSVLLLTPQTCRYC
jgi:hypothetical protein